MSGHSRRRGICGPKPKDGIPKDDLEYRIARSYMREQWELGTHENRKEAVRIALQLLPYVKARLQAVVATTNTTINYIARLPAPIESITEWQNSTKLLLSPPEKPERPQKPQKASSLRFPDADPLSFGNLSQGNKLL
jgi:hypothetical protein